MSLGLPNGIPLKVPTSFQVIKTETRLFPFTWPSVWTSVCPAAPHVLLWNDSLPRSQSLPLTFQQQPPAGSLSWISNPSYIPGMLQKVHPDKMPFSLDHSAGYYSSANSNYRVVKCDQGKVPNLPPQPFPHLQSKDNRVSLRVGWELIRCHVEITENGAWHRETNVQWSLSFIPSPLSSLSVPFLPSSCFPHLSVSP